MATSKKTTAPVATPSTDMATLVRQGLLAYGGAAEQVEHAKTQLEGAKVASADGKLSAISAIVAVTGEPLSAADAKTLLDAALSGINDPSMKEKLSQPQNKSPVLAGMKCGQARWAIALSDGKVLREAQDVARKSIKSSTVPSLFAATNSIASAMVSKDGYSSTKHIETKVAAVLAGDTYEVKAKRTLENLQRAIEAAKTYYTLPDINVDNLAAKPDPTARPVVTATKTNGKAKVAATQPVPVPAPLGGSDAFSFLLNMTPAEQVAALAAQIARLQTK